MPRTPKTVVREIDFKGLIKKLRYLPELLKDGDLDKLVQQTTGKIVNSPDNFPGLIQVLPPSSKGVKGDAAGAQGMAKVESDIRKVYADELGMFGAIKHKTNRNTARAFMAAMHNKGRPGKPTGIDEARRIVQSAMGSTLTIGRFDGGALHQRNRDAKTGRVTAKAPLMLVTNDDALQIYVIQKQQNVGIMASCGTRAAIAFGFGNLPRFILRHGSTYSGLQILRTSTAFWVVVENLVPFGQSEIIRRLPYVLRYRKNALGIQIGRLIRDKAKQAGIRKKAA